MAKRSDTMGNRLRATALAVAALSLMLPAGCGGDSEGGPGTRVLRIGHIYDPAAPTHACGAMEMARIVNEADIGVEVRVHPAQQLGNESELLEQVAIGELEMSIAGPSFLATWHEPIGAFDAAYAFRDVNHMMAVMEGEIGAELWEQLRQSQGVRVLGTWPYGPRHLTANREIRTPDDLSGVRLRMPGASTWQATGAALGGRPVAIDFGEVYLALQQGLAGAQENPLPTIEAMGFHEVQDYLIMTGHVQSSTQLVVNDRVWRWLSDEQRQVIQQAVRDAAASTQQCIEQSEQRLLEEWGRTGELQVVEDVDVEAFRSRAHAHFEEGYVFSDIYRRIIAMDPSEYAGFFVE